MNDEISVEDLSESQIAHLERKYRDITYLTSGRQAIAAVAVEKKLERKVFLKIFRPNPESRLTQKGKDEGRALGQLTNHRNIGTIHNMPTIDGLVILEQQYYENHRPLSEVIEDIDDSGVYGELVQPKNLERIIVNITNAIRYGHEHDNRYLHKDIKPGNILIGREHKNAPLDGVLIDYGLVGEAISSDSDVIGSTIGYAAPETLYDGIVSEQTDIYSWGQVIYELFCGTSAAVRALGATTDNYLLSTEELKKVGRKNSELGALHKLKQQNTVTFPSTVSIDKGMKKIIQKCCMREPEQRYGSAAELERAIKKHYFKKRIKRQSLIAAASLVVGSTLAFGTYHGIKKVQQHLDYRASAAFSIKQLEKLDPTDSNHHDSILTLAEQVTRRIVNERYLPLIDGEGEDDIALDAFPYATTDTGDWFSTSPDASPWAPYWVSALASSYQLTDNSAFKDAALQWRKNIEVSDFDVRFVLGSRFHDSIYKLSEITGASPLELFSDEEKEKLESILEKRTNVDLAGGFIEPGRIATVDFPFTIDVGQLSMFGIAMLDSSSREFLDVEKTLATDFTAAVTNHISLSEAYAKSQFTFGERTYTFYHQGAIVDEDSSVTYKQSSKVRSDGDILARTQMGYARALVMGYERTGNKQYLQAASTLVDTYLSFIDNNETHPGSTHLIPADFRYDYDETYYDATASVLLLDTLFDLSEIPGYESYRSQAVEVLHDLVTTSVYSAQKTQGIVGQCSLSLARKQYLDTSWVYTDATFLDTIYDHCVKEK